MNETNVVPFVRPDPLEGIPDEDNWLKRLGVGTIFTCQRKNHGSDFAQGLFEITKITPERKSYGVINLLTQEPALVNPIRFCNVFELVEVLRSRSEYLAEQELNEQRDRANFPEGLEHNAEFEGGHSQDEALGSPDVQGSD